MTDARSPTPSLLLLITCIPLFLWKAHSGFHRLSCSLYPYTDQVAPALLPQCYCISCFETINAA